MRIFQSLLLILTLGLATPSYGQDPFRTLVLVNQTPITAFELDARIDLLGQISSISNRETLRAQALESLITEAIQMEEAARLGVLPSRDAADQGFNNLAANNGRTPGEFASALNQQGINVGAFKSRLRPQLAWRAVIGARVRGQVQVTDEELDERWNEIQASSGVTERRLVEVFVLGASRSQANAIASRMRSSGNFEDIARATSMSPSAANNGDIGWVRDGDLGGDANAAVRGLSPGQVSSAVAGQDGYFIYGVRGVRPVGSKSTTALFDVRRMFITLEANGASENDAQKLLALQNVLKRVDSCSRFTQASEIYGEPGTRSFGFVALADLPPQAAAVTNSLSVGEFSQFVPEAGGVAIYMKCGTSTRVVPLSRDEIRAQMVSERIEEVSADLMFGLRRRAYIEYR